MTSQKVKKKTDRELFGLLTEKISQGAYFFTNHAKKRLVERELLELEILDILIGKVNKKRKRNKRKEKYTIGCEDWNYCVEGMSATENKVRIVFSFSAENMVIITVIALL